MKGVFGGEEQDASTSFDRVTPQAGNARGHRDGDIQGQERLAALGLPADDPDRFF
jgi:hypothetical protein